MKVWIDKNGLMEPTGENGSLYTVEYLLLCRNYRKLVFRDKYFITKTLESIVLDLFKYIFRVENNPTSENPTEPFSHDNMTGILSLSYILDRKYHKKFFYKYWWRRIHPRDLGYYLYLYNPLFKPLLLITSIAMIISCFPSYKIIDGAIVPRTDGKILSWIRLNTVRMPITAKICTWLIKKQFGSWKNVFSTFFKDKEHPNNFFEKSVYDIY